MCFKKNSPKTAPEEARDDMKLIAEDDLARITGAGNPWEDTPSVPQQPIDEDISDRV